jgi:RIO kinase 2
MARLDASQLRYLSARDIRVLTAVEMGMKNHAYVPLQLITSISRVRPGYVPRIITNLLKLKLLSHQGGRGDGYALTYTGYDYLALYTLVKRGRIVSIGDKLGVGKEADIYRCEDAVTGEVRILKFLRIGRTSFRQVKNLRDWHEGRSHASWLYLCRLAALKEFAYMRALHDRGFPTPTPIDVNRHCVMMSVAPGSPLRTFGSFEDPQQLYDKLTGLIVQLARWGLVHGDFNEFNIMIDPEQFDADDCPLFTIIDFPQMISTGHKLAEVQFARDIGCIVEFFRRKAQWAPGYVPTWSDVMAGVEAASANADADADAEASEPEEISDDADDASPSAPPAALGSTAAMSFSEAVAASGFNPAMLDRVGDMVQAEQALDEAADAAGAHRTADADADADADAGRGSTPTGKAQGPAANKTRRTRKDWTDRYASLPGDGDIDPFAY